MSQKFSDMIPKSTEGRAEYFGVSSADIPTTPTGWSVFLKTASKSGDVERMFLSAMCWLERTGKHSQVDTIATQFGNIRNDLKLSSLQGLLETWSKDLADT